MSSNANDLLNDALKNMSMAKLIQVCMESGMPDETLFQVQINTKTVEELKLALFKSLIFSYGISNGYVTEEQIEQDIETATLVCTIGFVNYMHDRVESTYNTAIEWSIKHATA